ncbi:hypothetical protein ACGFK1_21575 [Mycobacterium sp. NPDC048908]|uniref:hypothetical protein n=1 Tax=Mycobacterium sp. NPDC048908 TaxID=3364292 RepID=UPI003719E493
MQLAAARASIATGVAIVGASVLVASPVAPPMPDGPDVRLPAGHSVQLTALVNPIAVLTPIFQQAFQNAGALGQELLHAPAAVAQQIITGQLSTVSELLRIAGAFGEQFATALGDAPAMLHQAIGQISAGQITAALNTLTEIVLTPVTGPVLEAIFSGSGPLVDLVDVLSQSLRFVPGVSNAVELLADPDFLLTVGLGPLQSIYALNTAVGGTAETLIAAAKAGDPTAFVNGVTNGVADILSAVLDRVLNPGTPPYGYDRGLIAAVIEAGKMIIQALVSPAPASGVAAINATAVAAEATTVTLSTGPVDTPTEGKVAAETNTAAVGPAKTESGEPTAREVEKDSEESAVTEKVEAEKAEGEKAPKTPAVRTGLVAIPGEVTVGVSDKSTNASEKQQESTSASSEGTTTSDTSTTGSTTASQSGSQESAGSADNGGSSAGGGAHE